MDKIEPRSDPPKLHSTAGAMETKQVGSMLILSPSPSIVPTTLEAALTS